MALTALFAGLAVFVATALSKPVQISGIVLPPDAAAHKAAVVDVFTTSYDAYLKFAAGHDELEPIAKTFTDPRNGWGASLVDALDTLAIMGLESRLEDAINRAEKINFNVNNVPSETVNMFESTIRYIGGLQSVFELTGRKNPKLVQNAQTLANRLSVAFTNMSPIPFNDVNFTTSSPVLGETSNIAQAGTLTLEWGHLSTLTGNQTYEKLALAAVEHIVAQPDPLPGLAGQGIDPSTGLIDDPYVTWGGGSDSYFEYLVKFPRLTNGNDDLVDEWATAVDSSIRVLKQTSTVGDFTYIADFTDDTPPQIRLIGSHLECFLGGNWILGGSMLNNQTIIDVGLEFIDTCWNTYASTATGIGPEAFAFITKESNFSGATPSPQDLAFYAKHGFYVFPGDADYLQRPEVLESNFYAYRATGDPKYVERAASALASFQKFLKAGVAFDPINDVTTTNVTFIDDQQSFWLAETLKYLYLTFDDPEHISLNDWVFNTEAHPFPAPPAKAQYGTGKLNENTGPMPTATRTGAHALVSPNNLPVKPLVDLYTGI